MPNKIIKIEDTPWSAAFISYIMQEAGVDFPAHYAHTEYAQKIRSTPGNYGFKVINPDISGSIGFLPGDIVIQNTSANNKFVDEVWSGTGTHGDIVKSTGTYGYLIGGNMSKSVTRRPAATSATFKGPPKYFVVLRPPGDKVKRILEVADEEYEKWFVEGMRPARHVESDAGILSVLEKYYNAVGLSIEGIKGMSIYPILSAGKYTTETYIQPLGVDLMKILPAVDTRSSTAGAQITVSGRFAEGELTYLTDFENKLKLEPPQAVISGAQLTGELALLTYFRDAALMFNSNVANISSRMPNFIPSEQYYLVSAKLFEFFPDRMRAELASNPEMPTGTENTNSHAWRAPGKLATTVDLTMPGIAGFSVGQVFWVDRIYDMYKQMGVFQMFSFSDSITVDRGWTTSLHARLNIMPKSVMINYLNKQK